MAWAFFGPDEELSQLMNEFKSEVLSFLADIFRCAGSEEGKIRSREIKSSREIEMILGAQGRLR